MAEKKNFIKEAIKKPGALTKTAKEHGGETKSGKIKKSFLKEAEKGEFGKKAQKRANFAETLSKLRKKK
jgi:hypothetical protein